MDCLWRHKEGKGSGGHFRPRHLDQPEDKNFDWFAAIVPAPGTVLE